MNEETITISKTEYEELVEDSRMYHALQAAGVDNWEGYYMAYEIIEEWDNE